jgi:hypothetical protein
MASMGNIARFSLKNKTMFIYTLPHLPPKILYRKNLKGYPPGKIKLTIPREY